MGHIYCKRCICAEGLGSSPSLFDIKKITAPGPWECTLAGILLSIALTAPRSSGGLGNVMVLWPLLGNVRGVVPEPQKSQGIIDKQMY